jgi:GalNAc-alpha-(1->4)-GalNAc-alpha-(1->3)-diNAcBac-PP-undecaprenol alpha-1,4-N-acetyl-D-galactosaminyltransferase
MTGGVVLVIESLGGGGAQHVATTLANAWAANGAAVEVVTLQGSDRDFFRLNPRIARTVVGGFGGSSHVLMAMIANLRRIFKLRQALKRSAAKIVVSFIGSTNVLTILAARGLGMRLAIAERNDPQRQSLGWIWDRLRVLLYGKADLVVVNSRDAVTSMAGYVPRERMIWLPNPLRTAPPNLAPVAESGFFLAVGRLQGQKGYDVLLSAFADVVAAMPQARLVVLGEGPLRETLQAQAGRLNLTQHVSFMGQVNDPFPWYRAALAFVHPARFEGMPNAVLEAMSEGLPVIVTAEQTGLRGIVHDGRTGFVVPAESARALADAMLSLVKNSTLREAVGRAARDAVAPFEPQRAIAAWSKALFDTAQ